MSSRNAQKQTFPLTVKRGSSSVKIYRDVKLTGTYYRVAYHLGGKRHRMNFADLETAASEAEAKAAQLSRGDVDAMQLSGRDRLIYGRALDAVRASGTQLDAAALEYASAIKILDGLPLLEAARFYVRHHGRGIKRKPIREAIAEMITSKQASGVSALYLADLRYRLGGLAERFHGELVSLTGDDVRGFFDELSLSPRSYNNFLGALRTFFAFAADRGWLPKDADLLASVKRRKEKRAAVEIFTPAELGALLTRAPIALQRCFALGAFAGLRSEEILRLEWADVRRRPGFIEIAADKAKTASRRLVPIRDNLARWLSLAFGEDGRVWPHTKATYFKKRLAVATGAKVDYRPNALRHSYISYRLAEIADVNRVALEAGNSPQMIFRNYRELATPAEAEAWFGVCPTTNANIIPLRINQ